MERNEVFTQKSVELLRHWAANNNLAKLDLSFDELVKLEGIELVQGLNTIPKLPALEFDSSLTEGQNDARNSLILYNALREMTPAMATDERLWVTLCFGEYRDYAESRHPHKSTTNKNYRNRYFASNSRDRWRNNAVSRLWWSGFLASELVHLTTHEAVEIMYFQLDLVQSLLGRSTTASNPALLDDILVLARAHYLGPTPAIYKRDAFRDFLKDVDLIGGVTQWGTLSFESRNSRLVQLWNKHHA